MKKSFFGGVDVESFEGDSCAPDLIDRNIVVSNIAMKNLMNILDFTISSPYYNFIHKPPELARFGPCNMLSRKR
jgi:hypothetical protein